MIEKLGEQKPSSAKLAYRLSRIVTSMRSEHDLLNKAQLDLLKTHGSLIDPDKGTWELEAEKRESFETEWRALLETEIEIWGDPIKVDDLDGHLALTVDDYTRLEWLFSDTDSKT